MKDPRGRQKESKGGKIRILNNMMTGCLPTVEDRRSKPHRLLLFDYSRTSKPFYLSVKNLPPKPASGKIVEEYMLKYRE